MKIQKIKFMRIRSVQQTSLKFQVRSGPNRLLKYKIHKIIKNPFTYQSSFGQYVVHMFATYKNKESRIQ